MATQGDDIDALDHPEREEVMAALAAESAHPPGEAGLGDDGDEAVAAARARIAGHLKGHLAAGRDRK